MSRLSIKNTFRKRQLLRKKSVGKVAFFVNFAVFIGVGLFIFANADSGRTAAPAFRSSSDKEIVDPLDKLSSADIAVNVAELVRMEQATAVRNNADTINSQLAIVPNDNQVVAKPQIVTTELKSISDLVIYVSVEGDTVDTLAEKYGVSSESLRWSNDLSGSAIPAGTELKIPPVEGLVYTVDSDDTLDKIVERYEADKAQVIAFNDIELSGIQEGQTIVLPDGKVPPTVTYSVPTYGSGFRFGSSPVYGYNGYDYGYCTWYTANRRADVGRPIPANLGNASTWKVLAQRAGLEVGSTPRQHAVIWTPPRDYYGHVAFVEEVYEDGSILISEMNVVGWGVRSTDILSAQEAATYQYIY